MSLDLELIEATWEGDAPQPGGIRVALPPILRAWKRTLGAADTLRWIPDGEPFATWLDQVADSGGGEHLLTLDPIAVGALHATWGCALLPALPALRTSTTRHDFAHAYGVFSADDIEAVLLAWAACIQHALLAERGLIGLMT